MAALAGGIVLGPSVPDLGFTRRRRLRLRPESMFDLPAAESPIDTVVVLMLENRSFDHLYGWLGSDDEYLDTGRSLHGPRFRVDGTTDALYMNQEGGLSQTFEAGRALDGPESVRGCGYAIPGHTWDQGRAQRDRGFLAPGTGNDEFAITYYDERSIPLHRTVTEALTVHDRNFSSLLGPTFPNRQYLHSAQSEGLKGDPGPLKSGIFKAETIWDRLLAANVPSGYYYTDVPLLRLWGPRLKPLIAPLSQFFEQAFAGTLPSFVMVDPGFKGGQRSDGHPRGDVRLGTAFTALIVELLLTSPQWPRTMLVVTHDEWGGFFDHVAPPQLADGRASARDEDDFGQAGFRVPAGVLSPYSPRHAVDHTPYDHTSILRFLEWRFLGAPASGPAQGRGGRWWLTERDRHAHPVGQLLTSTPVSLDVDALVAEIQDFVQPKQDPACAPDPAGARPDAPLDVEGSDPFVISESFGAEIAADYPPTELPWQSS